ASSRRGRTTVGPSAADDGANASGVGGSNAIAEVATVGSADSVDGEEPSSGSGFVRASASRGNESLAMAVQPLLRRRIIRTMNRSTTTGTPTAIPARLTAVKDQVGPAGADRARTSMTHWKSADADPSDTTTFTANVPVSLRPNSKADEDPPTGTPFTVHAYVSGSPSGSNAPTWNVVDSEVLSISEAGGVADSMMGPRFPISIVLVVSLYAPRSSV